VFAILNYISERYEEILGFASSVTFWSPSALKYPLLSLRNCGTGRLAVLASLLLQLLCLFGLTCRLGM